MIETITIGASFALRRRSGSSIPNPLPDLYAALTGFMPDVDEPEQLVTCIWLGGAEIDCQQNKDVWDWSAEYVC
jgi:hypothetical protein